MIPEPVDQEWSPDYPLVIRDRIAMVARLDNSHVAAAARLHYRAHPVDFVADWAWTYDPRLATAWVPMVLWRRQAEFLRWLHGRMKKQTDGMVEKSRDAGATWLCVAFAVWAFLFVPGIKIGFGSRKEQLVDRIGDPDSIFEKIRLMLSKTPNQLLPNGWDGGTDCSYLKVVNRENGAAITGEAGQNIGRGGRNTMYFVDEAAFLDHPKQVDAALSQNTNSRIDVSTPNGVGNPFYRRRHSGAVDVFVFDWRDDPRKDQEWYDAQAAKLDPMILAQEIDRDYDASAENVLVPAAWVKAAVGLNLTPSGAIEAGLDVADEGPDSNCLVIRHGPVVQSITEWKKGTTTQTAQRAVILCREHGAKLLKYDSIGVGAGVKGELARTTTGGISVQGINVGSAPSIGWYTQPTDQDRGKKNSDMFTNLKAELWWSLRRRFQRTYEHVAGVRTYPHDALISLPADSLALQTELSGPKYEPTETGKIKVESKRAMASRGLKSPNQADALVISFGRVRLKQAGTW